MRRESWMALSFLLTALQGQLVIVIVAIRLNPHYIPRCLQRGQLVTFDKRHAVPPIGGTKSLYRYPAACCGEKGFSSVAISFTMGSVPAKVTLR